MRTVPKIAPLFMVICLAACPALAETVSLPSFSNFVWGYVPPVQVQDNASYAVYAWEVSPNIGKTVVWEYMNVLVTGSSALELACARDEANGDFMVAYALPSCAEKGFRANVGGQTVRGCHVLLIWKSDPMNDGGGAVHVSESWAFFVRHGRPHRSSALTRAVANAPARPHA